MEARFAPAKKMSAFQLLAACPSVAMQGLVAFLSKATRSSYVVIRGETGSGKELVARAIHDIGPHKDGRFVAVNCANFNRELVGSELFGHERGAFTGAIERHHGAFELANNGTLFLDEVGEFPIGMQSRLLRVLDSRSFERVGGSDSITSNFRLIVATNRDLSDMVRKGEFREDLYYRLNVISVALPSLRERPEDIPILVQYFIRELAPTPDYTIAPEAVEMLRTHSFFGNVRELKNVIERALALADGREILPVNVVLDSRIEVESMIDLKPLEDYALKHGFWPTLEMIERAILSRALRECGSTNFAAQRLKLQAKTAYNKTDKYGLRPPRVRRSRSSRQD